MLLNWFSRRTARKHSAAALYQVALEQSRLPAFYDALGVADTMDGRFDLLCLHAILMIDRLDRLGGEGRKIGQGIFDAMFKRMDLDLREMGIGDLGVPKHMQKMMKAFNGRRQAYHAALAAENSAALELAVARNVFRLEGEAVPYGVEPIAGYILETREMLNSAALDDFKAGRISFPPIITSTQRAAHG